MNQRCSNAGYARPTKSSRLRASANKFRESNESLPSPAGTLRRTYKVCGTEQSLESCSEPIQGRMEEPERPEKLASEIPQRLTVPAPTSGASLMQILESKYQLLQGQQTEFLDALKSLDPQDSKSLGHCKLVPLLLEAEDQPMPQNSPIDRVQNVKDRCQTAVDSGFRLLFDHLEPIQLARDELEACNQKGELMLRLKELLSRQMESISIGGQSVAAVGQQQDSPNRMLYQEIGRLRRQQRRMEARLLHLTKDHNGRMNRLKANIEGRLKAGAQSFQQTRNNLRQRMGSSEAQKKESARQLEAQNASSRSHMEQLISLNGELQQQVEESDDALQRTRRELEGSREHKGYLEQQLQEVQQQIRELQKATDIKDIVQQEEEDDDDQIISDLMQQQSKTLRVANDEMETKISELQEKFQATAGQVKAREQRAEQLHSNLEHVRAELHGLEQLMVEMRQQGFRDRSLLCRYTEEINALKQIQSDNGATTQAESQTTTLMESRAALEPLDLDSAEREAQTDRQLDSQEEVEQQQQQQEEEVQQQEEEQQQQQKEEQQQEEEQLQQEEQDQQQLAHGCSKLNPLQEKLRGLEEFTSNMSELNDCLQQIRDRQHERNIQLDEQISQLRSPMYAPEQLSPLFDSFSFSLVLHFINK